MKKITFKKIFKYDPTFNGTVNKYDGYELITTQAQCPGIEKMEFVSTEIFTKVFSSDLKRGVQSANLYSSEITLLEELKEIKFSLNKLISKKEFEEMGSNLVRERFIKSFINDSLIEKRDLIKHRVDKVLNLINSLEEGKFLFISHSFFMKILEVYLLKKIDIFSNPFLLKKLFDSTKKTYEFGEGFEIIY